MMALLDYQAALRKLCSSNLRAAKNLILNYLEAGMFIQQVLLADHGAGLFYYDTSNPHPCFCESNDKYPS